MLALLTQRAIKISNSVVFLLVQILRTIVSSSEQSSLVTQKHTLSLLVVPLIILSLLTSSAYSRPSPFRLVTITMTNTNKINNNNNGSVMLNKTEQKEERFWSNMAEKYSKEPIKDEATYQKKLAATRQYFTKSTRAFEFGCGTGSTALLHAPYVQHIDATDISSEMIQIAQRKAKDQGITNVRFSQTSLDKVMIPEMKYDMVLGLNILHLLPDRKAAIRKASQLLKPGGVFVSSTVLLKEYAGNAVSTGMFSMLMKGLGVFGVVPTSLNMFNGEELKASLREEGFEIEKEFRGEGTKGFSPYAVFIAARKKY